MNPGGVRTSGGIEIADLKVRPLTDNERKEQLEQVRRVWWLKLIREKKYGR